MVEWFQGFYFKKRDQDVQQNAKTFAIGIGGFDTYISTYKNTVGPRLLHRQKLRFPRKLRQFQNDQLFI